MSAPYKFPIIPAEAGIQINVDPGPRPSPGATDWEDGMTELLWLASPEVGRVTEKADEYCQRYDLAKKTTREAKHYDLERDWPETAWPNAGKAGVYAIFSAAPALLYIGKTNDFGRRLSSYFVYDKEDRTKHALVHDKESWTAEPRYILTFPVENDWEASSFEEYMILKLDPPANTRGRVPKDSP